MNISYSVKRSKFEYIKQLFSKKPDKPKKYSAPSSLAPRSTYTFQRPSDVTSNYSTSDYASDQELDDTAPSFAKIRPQVQLNRNSKIASIVKRFEPNSPIHTENSRKLIDNPTTSEVIERTHSQALMDIQAISSDLSSLMTNISYLSSNKLAVNNTSYPHKQLVVETLLEPQINEDDNYTPKVTTSYSVEDKKQFDLTLDSCHSSEHGDDVLSLDDFLSNLTPPKLSHTRYPRYSQEDELDSDTNTEKGSTDEVNRAVADMTSSTDMEMTMESTLNETEIQHEIIIDASINPETILHKIQLNTPAYINVNRAVVDMTSSTDMEMTMESTLNKTEIQHEIIIDASINPETILHKIQLNTPAYINVNRAVVDMTSSTDMEMTMESTLNETEITMDASINPEANSGDSIFNQMQLNRPAYIDLNSKLTSLDDRLTRIMQNLSTDFMDTSVHLPNLLPIHNSTITAVNVNNENKTDIIPSDNVNIEVTSPTEIPTTDNPLMSPVKLPQSTIPVESPSLQHRHAFSHSYDDVTNTHYTTDSDACSVHSTGYPSRPHKYTGYSLPPGETRSVSERIQSLFCREPIDCPKVDKLSLARAAIERRKSEAKPAYLPDRPVLLEIKEPEDFSVRSLRDRFEVKMRLIEPSGVMLSPSQIPKPARKKSEDLGIKPTFAG